MSWLPRCGICGGTRGTVNRFISDYTALEFSNFSDNSYVKLPFLWHRKSPDLRSLLRLAHPCLSPYSKRTTRTPPLLLLFDQRYAYFEVRPQDSYILCCMYVCFETNLLFACGRGELHWRIVDLPRTALLITISFHGYTKRGTHSRSMDAFRRCCRKELSTPGSRGWLEDLRASGIMCPASVESRGSLNPQT